MRPLGHLCLLALAGRGTNALFDHDITTLTTQPKHILSEPPSPPPRSGVSQAFFASLERLARLVDITYCVGSLPGVTRPFTCASRCRDFPTVELVATWNTGVLMTDSCGYVAVDHGDDTATPAIVVAFRGTYSIANTVVDLGTVPQEYVPYPDPPADGDARERCSNCTVHMGFLASWRSARGLVLPALDRARAANPGYPVRMVGHSLGGAVAALAALELRLVHGLSRDEVEVTTFGEPRMGNKGLAGFVDRVFGLDDDEAGAKPEALPYRRVTHADDPVPLLPLAEWGYRSHGGEVYIEKGALPPAPADLRMCRGARDSACSDGGGDSELLVRVGEALAEEEEDGVEDKGFPTRLKLWELFFAHRDYFWRLGLCVPGGDPADWWRDKYDLTGPGRPDEL